MSRASKRSSFADFFPTAPSVLQEKRAARHRQRGADAPSDILNGETVSSSQSSSLVHAQTTSDKENHKDARVLHGREAEKPAFDHDDKLSTNGDVDDLLNAVGSASSHNSTHSSVFSHGGQITLTSQNGAGAPSSELTPLTNHEPSPPERFSSPRSDKLHPSERMNGVTYHFTPQSPQRPQDVSPIMTPPSHSKNKHVSPRPPHGMTKGLKSVYDPELDSSVSSKEARKLKPRFQEFGKMETAPPPDPRLAMPGYKSGGLNMKPSPVSKVWKFRLRPAPYTIPSYSFDPNTSIGPGPPTSIVITGFDPFTPATQLRALFSSYGEIAELDNKTDPTTGTFLGICSVKYRDTRPGRSATVPAAVAAKRAETEGSNQRLSSRTIKVERDRGGSRCKRYVENKVRRNREHRAREAQEEARKRPPPPPATPATSQNATDTPVVAPINAPKGPSVKPSPASTPSLPSIIETEPILSKIKRKPYVFISADYVAVMGPTLPHLKKRLKMVPWEEIRCDETGWYIIFEDHKRGELEALRCFNEYHGKSLFDYKMIMQCQEYGNPNYERSPSPQRAAANKKKREELARLRKEEEMDIEEEKKQRASDLDPVYAALEQLRIEIKSRLLGDIKSRITAPALYDFLDPDRHSATRQKLGIADPTTQTAPPTYLSLSGDAHSERDGPSSKTSNRALQGSAVSRLQREEIRPLSNNAFIDERRQFQRRPKRKMPTSLHQRLQETYGDEEDSDDEHRTAVTRDTEEQESRPASRMSSMPRIVDRDEETRQTPHKRRRIERDETPREDESGDENMGIAKSVLDPWLLKKETEDMALAELHQIIKSVPSPSRLHKRAKAELQARQKATEDDRLFRDKIDDAQNQAIVDTKEGDNIELSEVLESTEFITPLTASKKPPKPRKKKSKKQVFEEREQAKADARVSLQSYEEVKGSETPVLDEVQIVKDVSEEKVEEEEEELRTEVIWGVSTEAPRRTVEDDLDVLFDLDGWQNIIKDDEDLVYLKEALHDQASANIEDAPRWAHEQKEIKSLNNEKIQIDGYYVPNITGSARTEGVKRILESEKSKYLPHRIKVAKAREKREAEAAKAKNNPTIASESARLAKLASTTTSRSNRANNRTHIKDINTAKQNLAADGQQGDAIRFNQLKKRKKLVKFDRSAIHGWGLYAEENIAMSDMIIEYVGEKVRQAVANVRELRYDKQGMGSSYLFRIDEDTVVDATKKGGIARFINHSCAPNCTAKIIRVDDELRIGIYSKVEIKKGDELTYDYKFDREADDNMRVPCLCGSDVCKGFLN